MSRLIKVIYVGTSGFPFGLAQVERQKLIARGLQANNADVLILSRYGTQNEGASKKEFDTDTFDGIPFAYACGYPYRPASFLKRNFYKFKGLFNEFLIIRKHERESGVTALLVSTLAFYNILYYRLISKMLGIPMVIDNIEYFSSMNIRKSSLVKIDNYLYDNYSFRFADRVIGISDFLLEVVKQASPTKPILKIPSIVDFSRFRSDAVPAENFFLYCGQAAYFEVIAFIIDSYEKMEAGTYSLYLVSNGNSVDMEKLRSRIQQSPKSGQIRLFSGLPFQQLVDLYMTSKALLIPLRNTRQDIARFPHKIGEYCAAGKPIISTRIGEVGNHFQDGVNALLAESYEVKQYAEKMQEVVDRPERAVEIGQKGHLLGKENFDYISLGAKIKSFIS